LHDEGYSKSIYVNSLIPHDPQTKRFFYLATHEAESWILLLVKALAKYAGSYQTLSTFSFERLSSILLGSQPALLQTQAFSRIYERKFPEYNSKFRDSNSTADTREQMKFYSYV